MNLTTKGTAILGAILFATSASAQTMTVTPGSLLRLLQTATITYVDRAKAGQTVHVAVQGGWPVTSTIEIAIVLDDKGRGVAFWTAVNPLWSAATFIGPGVPDVTVPIG